MKESGSIGAELTVIIPVHNESATIDGVLSELRSELGPHAEILVVDDGSTDGSAELAAQAGARVVAHEERLGNGAAVKTGIRLARNDTLVLMDGDGQHNPKDLPRLLDAFREADLVVGARTTGSDARFHRRLANWLYNQLATYLTGRKVPDLTSGFRAMSREKVLPFVGLLPNAFSYPATTTILFIKHGYRLRFVPIVSAQRQGRSKIRLVRDGLRFLYIILRSAVMFAPSRLFIPASVALFLPGFIYGTYTILRYRHLANSSMFLLSTGVLTFLMGLVSEQVAALRLEMSRRTGPLTRVLPETGDPDEHVEEPIASDDADSS